MTVSRPLAERAAALLKRYEAAGLRIATAESCTGGLVAARLTEIPGSSTVVDRGFVTYSNAAKTEMLGVPAGLIAQHGAVSEAVARAMAEGALARSGADVAVAVTGIAGPGGATAAKPVGLVHFAVARAGETAVLERRYGDLGRSEIRETAVGDALALLEGALSFRGLAPREPGTYVWVIRRACSRVPGSPSAPRNDAEGAVRLAHNRAQSPRTIVQHQEFAGMSSLGDWKLPLAMQPKPKEYGFDLDRTLESIVGLRTTVPADAFTAETLGTERAGNGVLIRGDGLVLTIGYLVTEAETLWLHLSDGRVVPGHVLAYDQATGFGLVQALTRLDLPALALGDSSRARVGERVVTAGFGGRERSVAARIVARQEFAGYWEYVLDEAIFTAPAHPFWGGTALIGSAGDVLGVGSLQLQGATERGSAGHLNMIVPIDLLKPILDDLLTIGRADRPPRPWLGLYATEIEDRVVVMGVAGKGPAQRAGLRAGDLVLAVADEDVSSLAGLFRRIWALGEAGVDVPLTLHREGDTFEVTITSGDRSRFLKAPPLH